MCLKGAAIAGIAVLAMLIGCAAHGACNLMSKKKLPVFDSVKPWGAYAPTAWQRLLLSATHALPHALRRLVFALRKPIKYGVHHPLDVSLWDLKLRVMPRGNITETDVLFAPQFFDPDELRLLSSLLKPGCVFVDIGANVGMYSFWANRCMSGAGRVIAVEPDPEMLQRLRFNAQINAMSQVVVCPVALSDHQGEGELLVNPEQRGENTLDATEAKAAGGERVLHKVELDTLVHLLQVHGVTRVDALKIDIEGYEPPVLRHFFANAPRSLWPRLAITEYKRDTAKQIEGQFLACGYKRVLFTGLNFAFALDA
jgi:FkbM family methyltransferase